MPGNQTTIQQLIQQLVPSGVNNGNPNTVYNTAATPYSGGTQPVPLPPMQNAQGNWFMNSVSNAANMGPINLQAMPAPVLGQPWQPSSSLQARLPVWPTPFDPAQYGTVPAAPPVTGGPAIPSTPVIPPSAPITGGGGSAINYGSGGGGFGDVGCVTIDSVLEDYDRADDVQFGDTMFVIDPVTFKRSTGEVSYSETKVMPCVRITTESGIELECSTTAPIADEKGEQVLAPNLLNKLIPVSDNGVFYLDRVLSVEDIGDREIRHITVENNFFLAGKQRGRYIFHHNIKHNGASVDLLALADSINNQFGWSRNTGGFGAESMGGGAPNTRGAMQANGTWFADTNYTPTGQGLIDAFGEAADPATGESMVDNPWSTLNTTPYDSQWFQENQLYQNGTSNLGSLTSPTTGSGGSFFDKVDNSMLGDVWNSETGSMNWGNLLAGIGELATGIPINAGRMAMGTANLMTSGTGTSADYARNQLRNTYNGSNQEQRTQLVSTLAERYNLSEQQVRDKLGVGQ